MSRRPHSMRLSGASDRLLQRALTVVLAGALLTAGGCLYSFSGGGLPSRIRTIAVVPFENQTPVPDVQRQIADSLRTRLANRLGLREAPVDRANAVVRGTIRRYEVDIPVGYNAQSRAPTAVQRMLQIVLDIDVVDQATGKSLWSRKGYQVEGQYDERNEAVGRARAIDLIVTAIVDGVQSQW